MIKRKLSVDKYTVLNVGYSELERFIKQEYGQEYEIACGEEMGNDSSKEVSVKNIKPLTEYNQASLDEWKTTGKGEGLIHILIQDMVNERYIEPGVYLIDICW